MDPEAYRCPKCRIYFCFKCRRRVQVRDPQYQCMNQKCDCYGKLLCNACVVEVPQKKTRTRAVPEPTVSGGAIFGAFLLVLGLSSILARAVGLPDWGTCGTGLLLGVIVAAWLGSLRSKRHVTETVEAGRMKSCIACRQAVEHLR